MHTLSINKKQVAHAIGAMMLTLGATQAFATGFQLNENSASSLGNAFAAGAAFTDDVSAMWWNPAALSQFPKMQAAAALHIITPSVKFQNNASLPAANQPLGNNGGDAGGYNFVPNMFLSVPINAQWTFGLGVNAPFGLTTEYDDGWIGRYQALKSQIQTININPAIAWKVTPQFSVGVGVNYQQIDATLTQQRQLLGRAADGRRQGRHCARVPDVQRHRGVDPRPRLEGDDRRQRLGVGLEHRLRVGCDAATAPGRELPVGDQVRRSGQHQLREPDGRAAAGHAGATGRHDRRALRRRQQPAVVRP